MPSKKTEINSKLISSFFFLFPLFLEAGGGGGTKQPNKEQQKQQQREERIHETKSEREDGRREKGKYVYALRG